MTEHSSTIVDFEGEVRRRGLQQPFEEPNWQGWAMQLLGRHLLKLKRRCILSMDKGLGKTSTILSIFEDPEVHQNIPGFTVIIFTPEKGMQSYIRDIAKFPEAYQDKIQLVYGAKDKRRLQWRNPKAKYFIVTYNTFLSDSGYRNSKHAVGRESIVPDWVPNGVDGVVCDEFHRVFRSRKSQTFELFKKFFRNTKYFFPISGSAVDKGPQDLWPALHLCDQNFWSSYHKYVNTWCEIEANYFGGTSIVGPIRSKVPQWQALMKHWTFHVTADMVQNMPEKTRDFLDCALPKWQKALHDGLLEQSYVETPDGDFIFVQNHLAKAHKLRLSLICPAAIDPSYGVGQGIEDIVDDALDGGISKYAIFTPYRGPVPILAKYLESRGARVWILWGSIGLDEQERRLAAWRSSLGTATAEKPSIILSTIKYAESWEIPEARYGYFLGEEYVREDNLQAEDRLRRLISVGITYIRYVRFKGTFQEGIIESLLTKANNFRALYNKWQNLTATIPKKS